MPASTKNRNAGADVEDADVVVVDDGQKPQPARRRPDARAAPRARPGGRGSGFGQRLWLRSRHLIAAPRDTPRARAARRRQTCRTTASGCPGFRCWLARDPGRERRRGRSAACRRRARCGSPTCVRSGPRVPVGMRAAHRVAHAAAALDETRRPTRVRARRRAAGARCRARHASNSAFGVCDRRTAPSARAGRRNTRRTGRETSPGRRRVEHAGDYAARESCRACRRGSAPRSCGSRRPRAA